MDNKPGEPCNQNIFDDQFHSIFIYCSLSEQNNLRFINGNIAFCNFFQKELIYKVKYYSAKDIKLMDTTIENIYGSEEEKLCFKASVSRRYQILFPIAFCWQSQVLPLIKYYEAKLRNCFHNEKSYQ